MPARYLIDFRGDVSLRLCWDAIFAVNLFRVEFFTIDHRSSASLDKVLSVANIGQHLYGVLKSDGDRSLWPFVASDCCRNSRQVENTQSLTPPLIVANTVFEHRLELFQSVIEDDLGLVSVLAPFRAPRFSFRFWRCWSLRRIFRRLWSFTASDDPVPRTSDMNVVSWHWWWTPQKMPDPVSFYRVLRRKNAINRRFHPRILAQPVSSPAIKYTSSGSYRCAWKNTQQSVPQGRYLL